MAAQSPYNAYTPAPAGYEVDPTILLTMSEAGDRVHLSRSTMQRLVRSGKLRSVRIGRSRRVAISDLLAFVDGLTR